MARSKKQQTVSDQGAIANATSAIVPSSAAAPSRAAMKDKVPAGNKGVLVQTLDEWATEEVAGEMQRQGTRIALWIKVIQTYGHDLEALSKYPEMVRNKLGAQYGLPMNTPRKQWSEGDRKLWDTLKANHLSLMNRVWYGLGQIGAQRVLQILRQDKPFALTMKDLPKIPGRGRPVGSTNKDKGNEGEAAETAEGTQGGKHPAAPAPASKPAPTGMQAMFAALTTLKADELTAVCLKAAEVLKAKDSSKPAQAFADTISRAYAAWEQGGIVQEQVA